MLDKTYRATSLTFPVNRKVRSSSERSGFCFPFETLDLEKALELLHSLKQDAFSELGVRATGVRAPSSHRVRPSYCRRVCCGLAEPQVIVAVALKADSLTLNQAMSGSGTACRLLISKSSSSSINATSQSVCDIHQHFVTSSRVDLSHLKYKIRF